MSPSLGYYNYNNIHRDSLTLDPYKKIITPCCCGNRGKVYHIYKLKEGSSRLDRDITGIKKPLVVTGALKSCYITPEYGRCEDNNVGVNKLALLQT